MSKKVVNTKLTKHVLQSQDGSITVHFQNLGAAITHCFVYDGDNNRRDIVLGYNNDIDWLHDTMYLGVIAGRVANRCVFCPLLLYFR